MTQTEQPKTATPAPAEVPDIQPFLIDPLILSRLRRRNVKPLAFSLLVAVVTLVAASWAAMVSGMFFTTAGPPLWQDLLLFVFRDSDPTGTRAVPYLRDYPSLVLTVTIVVSLGLVYDLYTGASALHSDMAKAGCVSYTPAGKSALIEAVTDMNRRFERHGRFAPLTLLAAFGFTLGVNLLLGSKLFEFLVPGGVYAEWWASLTPLRPGGVVWVVFGTLGVYAVYAESVLGLAYVRFLRRCRDDYRFKANMVNPDGFYGWSSLRQIVSNLEAGVVCTLLSVWAMSFFVQPAIGSVAAALVIVVFAGIVIYVFVQVNLNFRRQVRHDKLEQRREIADTISGGVADGSVASLLRVLVAYRRLELVERVPSTPIRQKWLVAGALSILGPLSAIVVQLIKYFTST
ncbi:hypothetical protein [Saccharothrix stipae]